MINPKIVEAALGMLAKMVPPETYAQIVAELKDVVTYAKSADDRLAKLEALADRLTFLETVIKNTVDGAGAAFAERQFYAPSVIDAALAPAGTHPIHSDQTHG